MSKMEKDNPISVMLEDAKSFAWVTFGILFASAVLAGIPLGIGWLIFGKHGMINGFLIMVPIYVLLFGLHRWYKSAEERCK